MDPQNQFTTPASEWAALLALAAETNPAQTCRDWDWTGDLFSAEGTAAAFAQVAGAKRSTIVDVPEVHAAEARELLATLGADALDELRGRLGKWATARAFLGSQSMAGRQALDTIRAAHARGEAPDLAALIQGFQGALDDAMAYTASNMMRATLGTLAAGYWESQAERRAAMPTGLGSLDRKLGDGFQPRRLVCLLGAPGSGKTTLANQWAEHIANAGRPVVYLTTEDTPATLLHKTIARLGDLDYSHVQRGTMNYEARIHEALAKVAERTSATRLLYMDRWVGIGRLRAVVRSHFARHADAGPGLVVVDYLQRIAHQERGDAEVRLAVSALAGKLSDLAKDLDCTVLALGSQSRGAYAKGPNGSAVDALASGKESGDIEYAVDVLMTLAPVESPRWEVPAGQRGMALSLPKNRQGEVTPSDGFIRLNFYGARQYFTSVTKGGE